MDRLSPLDSLFLHVEDGVTHMHIASCAIFERPRRRTRRSSTSIAEQAAAAAAVSPEGAVRAGSARPAGVGRRPALQPRLPRSPLGAAAPGGEAELDNLMGRLMAVELDRHRPLWEIWMVEGLTGGRWALISKVHHCMVDGVSGTDLMVLLLDSSRRRAVRRPREAWAPAPEPSDAALTVDAVVDLAAHPGRAAARRRALLRGPRDAVDRVCATSPTALLALGRDLRPAPTLSIEGAIGPHRRWAVRPHRASTS